MRSLGLSRVALYTLGAIVILLVLSFKSPFGHRVLSSGTSYKGASEPANSTLGFGTIYVVSGADGGERRHAIIQAANVTEIDLTIPQLPKWTDEDEKKFNEGIEPPVSRGTVFAWMSHRLILEQYVWTSSRASVSLNFIILT
jgi:hypothetical protein